MDHDSIIQEWEHQPSTGRSSFFLCSEKYLEAIFHIKEEELNSHISRALKIKLHICEGMLQFHILSDKNTHQIYIFIWQL